MWTIHHGVPRDACISPELTHSIVDFLVIMLDTQIDFFYSSWWGDRQLTMDVGVKRGQGSVEVMVWSRLTYKSGIIISVCFIESMCFNCFELYVMKITIYYSTKHLNHYLNYPFNWNTIDQILLNYRCCWSKTAKKWLAIVQALVNWDTTFLLVILIWWTRLNWN